MLGNGKRGVGRRVGEWNVEYWEEGCGETVGVLGSAKKDVRKTGGMLGDGKRCVGRRVGCWVAARRCEGDGWNVG